MSRKRKAEAEAKPPYEPTPEDVAAVEAMFAAPEHEPSIRIDREGSKASISAAHPDRTVGQALWSKAIGVQSRHFVTGMIDALSRQGNIERPGEVEANANFALAVVAEVEPRNAVESMLAAQMAAVHLATMRAAGALSRADMLPQYEAHERALNRLARTFATQVETLDRLRGGGKQVVEVRKYDVRGNNVVVGDVRRGGGGDGKNPAQPHEPVAIGFDPGEAIPPLWGEDPARDAVPVSSDTGEAPMQAPRRQESGRAEG